MNKYFPKSYKEKTNPYPSEEWQGRTMWILSHPLPPINEDWEFEHTEYNAKEELMWVLWESAYDGEQDIYDYVDYKLWNTDDIDPISLEKLEGLEPKSKIDEDENWDNTSPQNSIEILPELTEKQIIAVLNNPHSMSLEKTKEQRNNTKEKEKKFLKSTKAKNAKRKWQYRQYRA